MKKLFKSLKDRGESACHKLCKTVNDKTGELATNTIGSIIIAVVVVGLLILAINRFFPGFFDRMFRSLSDKLNANW